MKEKRNSLHDSDIKISVETVFKKDKADGVVLLYSKLLFIKQGLQILNMCKACCADRVQEKAMLRGLASGC